MEHRWYGVCTEGSILTRQQKEWPFIRTVGCARQIRIPLERDAEGNDITPAKRSKNNLALLRKFAYNILRLAMLAEECSEIDRKSVV